MEYIVNHFRKQKIGQETLITTDQGGWILLNDEDYINFRTNRFKEELFNKLQEKGIVITHSNKEEVLLDYAQRHHFLMKGPGLHIIVPTLRCNLKCLYCHASVVSEKSKGYDMDLETAKKTADFILATPNDDIVIEFQGGEPLVNFDVIKFVVEYTQENKNDKKIQYTIVSNLTKLTDEHIKFAKEHKIRFCTSLDGPAHIHNKNRGVYHETLVKNIRKIKAAKVPISALMVTTRYSLDHPEEIIDFYRLMGFNQIWLRSINSIGFAKNNWDKIGYDADEYLKFWRRAIDYILKLNREGKQIREIGSLILMKKLTEKKDPMYTDMQNPCGGIIGQIAYRWDGGIYTCDEGRMTSDKFKVGDVATSTMKDVMSCNTAKKFMDVASNEKSIPCSTCVWKPFCGVCPVVNFARYGKMTLGTKTNFRCQVIEGQFIHVISKLTGEDHKTITSWLD